MNRRSLSENKDLDDLDEMIEEITATHVVMMRSSGLLIGYSG